MIHILHDNDPENENGSTLVESIVGIGLIIILLLILSAFGSSQVDKIKAMNQKLWRTYILSQVQRDLYKATSSIFILPWWSEQTIHVSSTSLSVKQLNLSHEKGNDQNDIKALFILEKFGNNLRILCSDFEVFYPFPWEIVIEEKQGSYSRGKAFTVLIKDTDTIDYLYLRFNGLCLIEKRDR